MSGATRTPILTALRRGRRQRQRGQALIEFAMFFLVLLYLLAGGTNITFLLNSHLNVVYAARQGARTGAVLGNSSGVSGYDSDCAVIGAIDAAVAGTPNLTINKISIYLAGANGQAFSPALQDRYIGNATCVVTGGVPAIVPSTAILIQGWLPAARANQPFTEASLGVRIDYTYKFQFPIVPGYASVSTFDYAVMPIDPVEIPTLIPCGHPQC
jgi:hypothetical protein